MVLIHKNTAIRLQKMVKHLLPLMILLVSACKEKFPAIPTEVIPLNKMENILIDMHISDAVAETKTMGDVNEKKISEQYYLQIYKNYGISKEDFLKSYAFYQNNPVLLNKMYDDVLSEMSRREAKINK